MMKSIQVDSDGFHVNMNVTTCTSNVENAEGKIIHTRAYLVQ